MRKELKFLIDIVKKASKLIEDGSKVSKKGSPEKYDLVTESDLRVETFLINEIKNSYPNFDIISEEFNNKPVEGLNYFTIDPLDGTINFAKGIPMWAIQMACVINNEVVASVIYITKTNELFYAEKGKGAFLNNKQIHVSALPLNESTAFVTCSFKKAAQVAVFNSFLSVVAGIRILGSASVTLAYMAAGRFECGAFLSSSLWDYLPGVLLIEEAGGYVYKNKQYVLAANTKQSLEIIKTKTEEVYK